MNRGFRNNQGPNQGLLGNAPFNRPNPTPLLGGPNSGGSMGGGMGMQMGMNSMNSSMGGGMLSPMNSGQMNTGPNRMGGASSGGGLLPMNSGPLNSLPNLMEAGGGGARGGGGLLPMNSGAMNTGPNRMGSGGLLPMNPAQMNTGLMNSGPMNTGQNRLGGGPLGQPDGLLGPGASGGGRLLQPNSMKNNPLGMSGQFSGGMGDNRGRGLLNKPMGDVIAQRPQQQQHQQQNMGQLVPDLMALGGGGGGGGGPGIISNMGQSRGGGRGGSDMPPHMQGGIQQATPNMLMIPPQQQNNPQQQQQQGGPPQPLLSAPVNQLQQQQQRPQPTPLLSGPLAGGRGPTGPLMNRPQPRIGALLPNPNNQVGGGAGGGGGGGGNWNQNRQYGGNRRHDYRKDSKTEEYDPANPTDDNGSSDGNFGDGNRKRGMRRDDGGPEAKRRIESGEKQYCCQMCSVGYTSLVDFDNHMNSDGHRSRMGQMSFMHDQQTDSQFKRMMAEKHLKVIENDDSDVTCTTCVKKFASPMQLEQHLRDPEHNRRKKLIKKGCILCKTGSFANYDIYKNHIITASHKKAKENLNEKKDEQQAPPPEKKETKSAVGTGKSEPVKIVDVVAERKAREKQQAEQKQNGSVTAKKQQQKPAAASPTPATAAPDNTNDTAAEDDADDVIPEEEEIQGDMLFDPEVAVGQEHVIAVRGYFCKLCHKFYKSEDLAKGAHCKSEKHFQKYQEYIISQQQEMDDSADNEPEGEENDGTTEHTVKKTPEVKKQADVKKPTPAKGTAAPPRTKASPATRTQVARRGGRRGR